MRILFPVLYQTTGLKEGTSEQNKQNMWVKRIQSLCGSCSQESFREVVLTVCSDFRDLGTVMFLFSREEAEDPAGAEWKQLLSQ